MNKPTKPNITIPEAFAVDGIKTNFTADKLQNGFDRIQPDVLTGDNLNKFIDDTYKGLNYAIAGTDAINLIQEDEVLTVKNGELVSSKVEVGANIDLSNLSTTGQAKFDAKVDLNASNLNTQGKSYVSGLGMPSTKYIDLTLGKSGSTYTAPANGWFVFNANATSSSCAINFSNQTTQYVIGMGYANNSNVAIASTIPAKKNETVLLQYKDCIKVVFQFIYAEGAKND